MDVHLQIKRKLLKILQDRAGCWTESEFKAIDAGTLPLEPYLMELVQHGYVYHDRYERKYILTDVGGRHLAELSAMEGPEA
ncbi:hypothetical protein YTPLAS18_30690 [Nitrospira sp.]|nr:hypothetical protein YTPLAS18_30690 [Nitrospira sp.]